jgi:hypothetical protein
MKPAINVRRTTWKPVFFAWVDLIKNAIAVAALAGSGKSRPFGRLRHNRRRVTRCGGHPMRGWDAKSEHCSAM